MYILCCCGFQGDNGDVGQRGPTGPPGAKVLLMNFMMSLLIDHHYRVILECVLVVLYNLLQEKHITLVKVLQEAKAALMSLNMAHWRIQLYHVLICLWKPRLNLVY